MLDMLFIYLPGNHVCFYVTTPQCAILGMEHVLFFYVEGFFQIFGTANLHKRNESE